jgi:uncharacterized protein
MKSLRINSPKKKRFPTLLTHLLKILAIGFVVLFATVAYGRKVEPTWIEIVQVPVTLPHLSSELEGYRIVQITDVHADQWMTRDRIAEIAEQMNQQSPDLMVLTGDYVTNRAAKYAPALKGFEKLKAPDGVLAVMGNHDHGSEQHLIREALEQSGIQVLHNEVVRIDHKGGTLQVAGVGDVWTEEHDLPKVLQELSGVGAAIMLAHEPDFADETAATGKFDLQLSGHSHGGQVKIPFIKRLTPPLGHKYPIGQYQVGDLIQYTSRGVGVSGLHVRFNCRPEITVLTLHSTQKIGQTIS